LNTTRPDRQGRARYQEKKRMGEHYEKETLRIPTTGNTIEAPEVESFGRGLLKVIKRQGKDPDQIQESSRGGVRFDTGKKGLRIRA